MLLSDDAIDPIKKFSQIAGTTGGASVGAVSRDDLLTALNGKQGPEQRSSAVVDVLTKNTSLTEALAKPIADEAVSAGTTAGGTDDSKTADSVLDKLGSVSGDSLTLSDPVMLWPWARLAGAVLFIATGVVSALFIYGRNETSSAYNVPLAVIAVAALLAALILIMGYKNVTISKGSSSGSGSSAKQ